MPVTSRQQQSGLQAYGERHVYARQLAGYDTQTAFAAAAGVDRQTVHRAEHGTLKLGTRAQTSILSALRKHVPIDEAWLVYGVGEPIPGAGAAAVEKYLKSTKGVSAREAVRAELRKINWAALNVANTSQKAIHRLREAIELNLSGK